MRRRARCKESSTAGAPNLRPTPISGRCAQHFLGTDAPVAIALGAHTTERPLPILLVARGTADVSATEVLDPGRGFGIGAAKVLPQELTGLSLTHIDVDDDPTVAAMIISELAAGAPDSEIAYRGGARYTRGYEPLPDRRRPAAGIVTVKSGRPGHRRVGLHGSAHLRGGFPGIRRQAGAAGAFRAAAAG